MRRGKERRAREEGRRGGRREETRGEGSEVILPGVNCTCYVIHIISGQKLIAFACYACCALRVCSVVCCVCVVCMLHVACVRVCVCACARAFRVGVRVRAHGWVVIHTSTYDILT